MRVVVHGLTKEFMTGQGKTVALAGVDLEVRDREFFGIIGPTGCGKTIRRRETDSIAGFHGVSGCGPYAVADGRRKRPSGAGVS